MGGKQLVGVGERERGESAYCRPSSVIKRYFIFLRLAMEWKMAFLFVMRELHPDRRQQDGVTAIHEVILGERRYWGRYRGGKCVPRFVYAVVSVIVSSSVHCERFVFLFRPCG